MVPATTRPLSKCSKCRRYCRLVATFLFSHIGLCALVVGYSIIGAFTFEALEANHEQSKRKAMLKERKNLVSDLWVLTSGSDVLSEKNWTALATETLQEFEVTLVKAVRKEGYDGKDESPLQWTFSGALLYSIIVITTIGYGNIAPKTSWGKIVTIFYAIVGIPLLLLCLSNIGDAMAHSFKFIYWKVCCYLCIRPKKRRKRPISKSVPIPYHASVIRHSAATNYRRPPLCGSPSESPQLASSSTYHTAPENSSPTISSSKSSPINTSNRGQMPPNFSQTASSPKVVERTTLPPLNHRNNDIAIISNKYALQEDVPPYPVPKIDSTSFSATAGVYAIMNNRSCESYPYSVHDTFPAQDRYQWKNDSRFCDNEPDLSDEDSVRDLSAGPEDEVSVPMWLCVALVVSYICGGAVLFTFWENWDFLDSSYFCFVTLTTIGFGDLVPGTAVISDDNQLTLGLCSLYLLFGMALLAMSFNLVQEEVTRTVKCVGKRIGIISDDEDD